MVPCAVLRPVHRLSSNFVLKNVPTYLPPNPHISETAFSHRFQKVYTYSPTQNESLAQRTKSSENPRKVPKPTVLAHSECPQEILQHNTTQHNSTQHNTTQHNTTQHNTTQHNTTQLNTTQHNTTQHNTTQHNTTQHNTTQHNTTQHNTTQHNTTQHNTTQHNTTQHSQGCA